MQYNEPKPGMRRNIYNVNRCSMSRDNVRGADCIVNASKTPEFLRKV